MTYKKEAKPDYSLLCKEMLDPVARVFTKGVPKHGRRNYLTNPDVTDEELIAAAGRHWAADASSPGAIDDGEGGMGEQHITCMIANGLMLLHRRAARAVAQPKRVEFTREWCAAAAEKEGTVEITAGAPVCFACARGEDQAGFYGRHHDFGPYCAHARIDK